VRAAHHEAYIPPSLRIDSSAFLMAGVRRLLRCSSRKQRQLAALAAARRRDDRVQLRRRHALPAAVDDQHGHPVLTHAATNGELAPVQLYLLCAQVAGQLATFLADVDPRSCRSTRTPTCARRSRSCSRA